MSPRLGTRARGSAAAPGQAGRRANPGRPGLHNAKYPPSAANITSSGENANAKPGRITGSQGGPRPCGGVEQKGLDTARSLLAPGVHVTATHTGPCPPPTDLTGADDYMTGLTAFAEPIVPGSVRELAGVGDDHNALLALDLQAAFDPSGPAVPGAPPGYRSRAARRGPSQRHALIPLEDHDDHR